MGDGGGEGPVWGKAVSYLSSRYNCSVLIQVRTMLEEREGLLDILLLYGLPSLFDSGQALR